MRRPFATRDPYPQWYRRLPIAVFMPWRNLGNPGLRLGRLYLDLFATSDWPGRGLFINTGRARYWVRFPFRVRGDR
jgi:hypothetical protein